MIGASALNVSAPVADQILTFLSILDAAKDPKAVKTFFADLQAERDKTREAELSLAAERAALQQARDGAQALIDTLPAVHATRAQVQAECDAALQRLSDARADQERREQELAAARADWINQVNATNVAQEQEKKALQSAWSEVTAAKLAISGEQAQLDIAAAEVEALRTQYETKLAKLRAAVGEPQ